MPSKNPRLNLTLEPDLYDLITELAELRGVSRASIVVDFLEAAEPTMRNLLVSLRAFMAAERESQERFISNLEEAEQTLAPIVAAALERAEAGVSGGSEPPHSNTGVTPSPERLPERGARAEKPSHNRGLRANPPADSSKGRTGGRE